MIGSSNIVRALAASTCIVAMAVPAQAQVREYNIPPASLESALDSYARQSGRQLIYKVDEVVSARSPGARGSLSADAALEALLAGTGFTVREDASGAVAIVRTGNSALIGGVSGSDEGTILVVGTLIRDTAPTSPVISIDRDAIDRGGYGTVQEAVSKVPQNFGGTTSATRSVTGGNLGASNQIDIRGLGSEATLTLVNGRRLAGAAGDQGRAVDISSIPLAAVERIDILTDGASALYGSDAIGGVVNLVLRDNYEGAELSAQYGVNSTNADTLFVSGVFGTEWSSGRLIAAAQYDRHEALRFEELGITSLDFTDRGGGDFRIATFGNPGTLLPAGFFQGQPFATLTAPDGSPVFSTTLPAGDGTNVQPGDLGLNLSNFTDPVPIDATQRQRNGSIFATVEQELGAVTLFADASASRRRNRQRSFNYFDYLFVPATNPFNPLAEPVLVGYELAELGPTIVDVENIGWFVNAGAKGELGFRNWTWEVVGSLSEDHVELRSNGVDTAELNSRLASSDPAFAFNPFGDGSAQPAGLAEALRQEDSFTGNTSLKTASALAQGGLLDLPGGELRLAVGAEYRRDGLSGRYETEGVPTQELFPPSSRDVRSIYGEAYLPIVGERNRMALVEELAVSIAARHDDYSDFGSTTNPKVGVRWRPVEGLVLKGNYGTSFRAPSLRELSFVSAVFPNFPIFDVNAPGGPALVFIDVIQGGNPLLGEEEAETYTLTAELRPALLKGARLSASYYHIDYDNRIRGIIDGLSFPVLLQFEDALPPGIVVRDGSGVLQSVNLANINSASTRMSGLDLSAGYGWSTTGWGSFDIGASANFIIKYEDQLIAGAPFLDLEGRVGNPPAWRGRVNASWNRGPWGANVAINHIDGLRNDDPDPSVIRRVVDGQTTVDAQISFSTDDANGGLLQGLTIRLGASNLFDKRPPFVDGRQRRGIDAQNYVIEGRTVYLRLSKAF